MTLRLVSKFSLPVLAGALLVWLAVDWWVALPEGKTATYVGRNTCAQCHANEVRKWSGSDHDRAMDFATPEFVLGDFNNTQHEHHGVISKMSRRGDEFFVETEGPDGKVAKFKVKYVFGYRPLQQYLTELDRGRVQVLPVTWDTEKKRWFYAAPDVPFGPDDPLHWTGSAQNWNHMCADCHSTNFAKNYDLETDTHHYSYSEMDVSCEACHGPGSIHVEIANTKSIFWDRRYGYGLERLNERNSKKQLETCAPCHAHRQRVYPGFRPGHEFSDHYSLSLLEDHLYYADGQINEEVYVYGSFLQSLMYRKGVRCTNCHDPHTTRIKSSGNALCTQCHNAPKYDSRKHHHHDVGTKGAACVECHMPTKTYMVVDPRRDHSLRVPRPDLTVSIGTPNACNVCHTKKHETPQWAAERIVEWYGPKRQHDPHYGEILAGGRLGNPNAERGLIKLAFTADAGPNVRATAVSLLATRYQTVKSRDAVLKALQDEEVMVRAAGLRHFEGRVPESRDELSEVRRRVAPLLNDPLRLVRTEAARILAALPAGTLGDEQTVALNKALEEYRTGLLDNADQSGAHVSLGILDSHLGQTDEAISEYRTAIRLDPQVAGPRSNLAELLDGLGQKDNVKQLRNEEAKLLARDAKLLPDNAFIHYRLGLLQYLLGNETEAERALSQASKLEPNSTEFLLMLALLYEKQKRWPVAIAATKRLIRLQPGNTMYRQMLVNFQQQSQSLPIGPQAPPGAKR